MRTMWLYVLPVFVIGTQGVMAGPYLHSLDGTRIELQISDSVVSVLFVTPALDSSAFARERPELRDDGTVPGPGGGVYVFAIEPGLDPVSVMQELRTDPRVKMVNPVIDDGQGQNRWMTDLLIVQYKDGTARASIDSLNGALASYVNPPDPGEPMLYFVRVRPDLQLSTLDVAELYYETGLCRYTQPNFIWQPVFHDAIVSPIENSIPPPPPPDTLYINQWHWDNRRQAGGVADADVDADSAWMITMGSPSVRVAIIDVGFNIHHEDSDSLTRIFGYDQVGRHWYDPQPDSNPYPDCTAWLMEKLCGHGTSILGELAAAHLNGKGLKGLAPHCTYWGIKKVDNDGLTTDSLTTAALRSAWTTFGCQIVSNSWGGGYSTRIEAQLDTMYRSGVAVFFAAGNGGVVSFPATLSTVTAVGATDPSDVVWPWSGKGSSLDIVAPGGDTNKSRTYGYIWTSDMMGNDGYVPNIYPSATCANSDNYNCKFGGTSSAAPVAAGIAALILSLRPDFMDSTNPAGIIRRILEASAEDKGPVGWDSAYGWGRVNAYRALLAACNCPSQGDVDTVNSPGVVDVMDVFQEIEIVFGSAFDPQDPSCPATRGDVNNDSVADVFDIIQIIAIAFSGGFVCNPCTPGVPAGCP